MKIALIVLAGLAALSAAVVVIGLMLPKQHEVSRSASFHLPPEQLFALISGTQNWRPEVSRYEAVHDARGRELFTETTKNGETITYEVIDANPPVSITRRIATPGLPYAGSWTFSLEATGRDTVVRITERGEVFNPVFRFMSRFVIGQSRGLEAYLQALAKATNQNIETRD